MKIGNKTLIVVGDRVLIKQEDLQERTKVGLYLPQTVVEKEEVQGGRIVLTGPGIPLPETHDDEEPWHNSDREPRYLPMQAEAGDYAFFTKKASTEIKIEDDKYQIVPHNAILVLIRDEDLLGNVGGLGDVPGLEDV